MKNYKIVLCFLEIALLFVVGVSAQRATVSRRKTDTPPTISNKVSAVIANSRSQSRRVLSARYGAAKITDYSSNLRKILEDKQPLLTFNWTLPPGIGMAYFGPNNNPVWNYSFYVENTGDKKSSEATIELATDTRPDAKSLYKVNGQTTFRIPPIEPKGKYEVSGMIDLSGYPQSLPPLHRNTAFAELPLFYWWITGELNDGKILSFYPRLEFDTKGQNTGAATFNEATLAITSQTLQDFSSTLR